MKKTIYIMVVAVCLALSTGSTAFAEMDYILNEFPIDLPLGISITTVKGTYDMLGRSELKGGDGAGKADVKNGFALSLELEKQFWKKWALDWGQHISSPGN